MKIVRAMLAAAATAAVAIAQLDAVTRVPSGDGQFWDIQDASAWSQDSGGIATGGRSNPFNGFGYLKVQVRRGNDILVRNHYLRGFGLQHDGQGRFDSITPAFVEGVAVDRNITTQSRTNYLRYVDTFTNTTDQERIVRVAWGGAVGAYEDGGLATVAVTSDADRTIEVDDSFVTMMQNAKRAASPA